MTILQSIFGNDFPKKPEPVLLVSPLFQPKEFFISIIIPGFNEAQSIRSLFERIAGALHDTAIAYEIIYVDDHSMDQTVNVIKQLQDKYPVVLVNKKGRRGKSSAILEGIPHARYDLILLIDADMQYPPEKIPEMVIKSKSYGAVVADRTSYNSSILRKIPSRLNAFIFGKILLGINVDVQSGLKLVKKNIFDHLDVKFVGPWSLDIPLLHTALQLGYEIGSVDITYEKRKNGISKLNFLKAAFEIAFSAAKLKLTGKKIFQIKPLPNGSLEGYGVVHKRKHFTTHTNLPFRKSALLKTTLTQSLVILLAFTAVILGLMSNIVITITAVVTFLSLIYFIDTLFNLVLLYKSFSKKEVIKFSREELESLDDSDLPRYTVLCPLYKEAHLLPQLINSLSRLNWPKDKLEIILLLENDDTKTINRVKKIQVPPYIRTMIVPGSSPKTKPKACNYGLAKATGEYVVIFDAEDKPEPWQLKKAYLGFSKVGRKVICLQAKLNFYNPAQNMLTKLFTAEYSLWFDIILPGLQAIQTGIPLGGTSNHFRRETLISINAWDPFNVTEDCDLGIRLFKDGFKTAIIESTTWEEANSSIVNWLRQRSRWIKGYIQTYFVHMRHPLDFVKKHGLHALIFQLLIGGRISFLFINPFLWIVTFSYFAFHKITASAIEAVYPPAVFYIAVISLSFGNFMYLYYYMIGCAKREMWWLQKYVFLVPVYWLMASVSAFMALIQFIFKPFYWEKTLHGLHLNLSETDFKQTEFKKIIPEKSFPLLKPLISNLRNFLRLFSKIHLKQPNGKSRILFFNWRDVNHSWAGGAEVYIHQIAKRWVKWGHPVTIFCGNDGRQKPDEFIDGVNVIRRGGFFTVYFWAFIYYIFKLRNNFDIIIDSANGIPFFTPFYSAKPKFLLIYHLHRNVFRKHIPFPFSLLAQFLETKLMPRVYKNQKIITISQSSKEEIIRFNITSGKNISVIPPGVDFPKSNHTAKSSYPKISYLGRLKPYKNINVIIEAFIHVLYRHSMARLYIAGQGESNKALTGLINQLGIKDYVRFLGFVSEKEKHELLAESWIALQPSSAEGWGMTVIEANAAGTPVVASDIPGLKDSVVNGKTGILVPPGDAAAFARAINFLIKNPEYLRTLSQNALNWAKHFNWTESVNNFYQVIKNREASAFGSWRWELYTPEGDL